MKKRPSPVSQHLLCQNLPSSAAAIGGERGDDRRQLLSSPRHRLLEAHQEALAARRSVNCLKPKVFVFRRHWGGAIGMAVRTRLEGLGPKLRSKNWSRRMQALHKSAKRRMFFGCVNRANSCHCKLHGTDGDQNVRPGACVPCRTWSTPPYGILFQRRNLADQPRSSLLLAQQSLLQKRGPFGTWEFELPASSN